MTEDKTGIYQIRNIINNKRYVGSSEGINGRWSAHEGLLNNKEHKNRYLQNAWNKDGKENFKFEIIEETVKDRYILVEREQYWLDFYKSYDSRFGYNIRIKAENNLGIKLGPYSVERRNNISNSLKGKMTGELNPSAKLTFQKAKKIRELYKNGDITFINLATLFNVSEHAIANVIYNKNWKDENYLYKIDKIEHTPTAKLNWKIVGEIREKYDNSLITQKQLSIEYEVHITTIKRIIQNRCWVDKNYNYKSVQGIKRRGFATTYKQQKEGEK